MPRDCNALPGDPDIPLSDYSQPAPSAALPKDNHSLPQPGAGNPKESPQGSADSSTPQPPNPPRSSYPMAVVVYQPVSGCSKPPPPPQLLMGPKEYFMSMSPKTPNCPRGLEYLASIDQLLVKQKLGWSDVDKHEMHGNNKYTIKNNQGQKVYSAVEETDFCTNAFCCSFREFNLRIFDNFKKEIIHVYRPFRMPWGVQQIQVFAPPGNFIGSIEEERNSSWNIKNGVGDVVMRIKGSRGHTDFKVASLTGEIVGRICKQWCGLIREVFTNLDTFGLTFSLDLDVHVKAILLGATVLFDILYFDKNARGK